jgi:hypothetical protein
MAEAASATNGGDGGGIGAILVAADRDFLVRNSGEQVRPSPVLGVLLFPILIVAQICDVVLFLAGLCPWIVASWSFPPVIRSI